MAVRLTTVLVAITFSIRVSFTMTSLLLPEAIKIGAVFETSNDDKEMTLRRAVDNINTNSSILPRTKLQARVKNVNKGNTLQAMRAICDLLEDGVSVVLTPTSSSIGNLVQDAFDAYNVPNIHTGRDYAEKKRNRSVNIYPDYTTLAKAYTQLIQRWNWRTFTIIYQQEKGLIRLYEVLQTFEIGSRITLFRHQTGKSYKKLMKEVEKRGDTNIILDLPTTDIAKALKAAKEFNLFTEYHNYLLTSMNLHMVDFSEVYNGVTNVTGFRIVDPEYLDKTMFPKGEGDYSLSWIEKETETILIQDAVMLFAKTIHHNVKLQLVTPGNNSCRYMTEWKHGNLTTKYMKVESFTGVSGHIELNNEGRRTNVSLDIVQIKKGGLRVVGNWSLDQGVMFIHDYQREYEEIAEVLANKTLRVSTILVKPYMMEKADKRLIGNDRFEGYCIDLLNEIKKKLKFDYVIIPLYGGRQGREKRPGSGQWDGIIGEVVNRKADIAIADLTITTERQEVVNFSIPFMHFGIGILFKKPDRKASSLFSFMYPFSIEVWITMITAYLGITIWMYILAQMTPYEWSNPHPCEPHPRLLENHFTHPNSLWFTVGSIMQQGSELAPRAISTRSLAALWWFFTLIMISTYTANLAAFLTAKRLKSPIESASDLASQNEIPYGCLEGGSTWNFFNKTDHEIYSRMFRFMRDNEQVYTTSTEKGVERAAKGNYAFIMETTSIRYARSTNCDLTQIGDKLVDKSYGIAFPQGSPYNDHISKEILLLQESGILRDLEDKWLGNPQHVCGDDSAMTTASELDFHNVGGIFILLTGGCVLSCMIGIGEFVWKTKKLPHEERESIIVEIGIRLKEILTGAGSTRIIDRSFDMDIDEYFTKGALFGIPPPKKGFNKIIYKSQQVD